VASSELHSKPKLLMLWWGTTTRSCLWTPAWGGNGHVRTIPEGSVAEVALEFRATLDYRPRPFLQLALCSFEEWSSDFHMQVLSQLFLQSSRVALDPFPEPEQSLPEALVLASQVIPGHGRFSCVRLHTPDKRRQTLIDPIRHFRASAMALSRLPRRLGRKRPAAEGRRLRLWLRVGGPDENRLQHSSWRDPCPISLQLPAG
jgi:hypothetical protein